MNIDNLEYIYRSKNAFSKFLYINNFKINESRSIDKRASIVQMAN